MTTITRTSTYSTTTTISNTPPSQPLQSVPVTQLRQAISELGQLVNASRAQMGSGMPTGDSMQQMGAAPMNLSGGQQAAPMDAYGAAKVLADNFRFIEGMGVNGKGKGSGDGLIGPKELQQILRPDSGASPQMRQAAQFLLDNGPARASIGKMTQDNLQSFASAAPAGSGLTGAPSLMPQMSSAMMSMLGGMGSAPPMASSNSLASIAQNTINAAGKLFDAQAQMMGGTPSMGGAPMMGSPMGSMPMAAPPMQMAAQPMAAPPMPMMSSAMMAMLGGGRFVAMDAGKAATVLQQNFDMLSHGKGHITMEDLKKAADPANGYPPEVRAAAKFLVKHGGEDGIAGVIGEASGEGKKIGPGGMFGKITEKGLNAMNGGADITKNDLSSFLNKNASV